MWRSLLAFVVVVVLVYLSTCLSAICKLENEASLRDFLNFWTWLRQKGSKSARLPQVLKLATSKTKHFYETSFTNCIFSSPCLWSIALATRKWCQVMQSDAPVKQNHLPETEDLMNLMFQNITRLRKSAPWPPNIFDDQFSHVLLTFDKVHNPLRRPRKTTSQLPKVVRRWSVLYSLTWTCASRQNGVQFFISHLPRWLRTRRDSELTSRPSGATNHWKNRVLVLRDFSTFSRTSLIFFLLLFSSLLSSPLLFSSLVFSSLLFSSLLFSSSLLLSFLRFSSLLFSSFLFSSLLFSSLTLSILSQTWGRGRGRGGGRERERETIKVIALYPCIVIASLAATKELRLWKDNASTWWGSRPPDPAFGNYNLLFLNFKVSTGCLTLQDISRPSAFMSTQGSATYL